MTDNDEYFDCLSHRSRLGEPPQELSVPALVAAAPFRRVRFSARGRHVGTPCRAHPLLAVVHRVRAVNGRLLIGAPGNKSGDGNPDPKVRVAI
jgi:hypothetical protein